MEADQDWRRRLEEAIKEDGRSARELSLALGRGPGYLFSILKDGRQPTLTNVIAICDELGVSALWLLYGVKVDMQAEELLRHFSSLSDEKKSEFLALAQSFSKLAR